MLIVNGTVHTMEVGTIPSGFVQTEGTRIVRVGPMSDLPGAGDADGIIDAKGGHILPGFIDAHCHVGLYGGAAQEDDLNESPAPCTPQLRALDGVDPMNHYFREARQAGITCVLTGPGSANPIGGQSVLLKTAGTVIDRMAVRAPAAMKFALGENPKKTHKDHGPATRMATASLIRDKLTQALAYGAKFARAQADGALRKTVQRGRLSLGELGSPAGGLETVLLALLHSGVAGEEAGLLQDGAVVLAGQQQGAGDAVAQSARLTADAAALDGGNDVHLALAGGGHQGLTDDHLQSLQTEILVNIAAVDGDGAGAAGIDLDAGDRGLSAAGAVQIGLLRLIHFPLPPYSAA